MELQKIYKQKLLNIKFEYIVLFSIYSLSILIPLLIGKPQLLVGSAVNLLIVFTTLTYGIKKTIPVLLLPSIIATVTGILFNGATIFLIYVLPFIMLSNFILSYFVSKKKMYSYVLGIVFKGLFLVVSYKVMSELIGLPSIFITSSYLQFITASIGVFTGYTLYKYSKR
ncbi:MAG TPA: hypothetical protein PKH06_02300 [Candidatus Dojkabacteria bacterium]|nr:hypothetical protein [Candidatus Dojkabacteria bacterium]HNW23571.1 hypothetical protein [Candidatus Dojkabacteria bacterium]